MVGLNPVPLTQDPLPDSVALHRRVSDSVTPDLPGIRPHVPDMLAFDPRDRHPFVPDPPVPSLIRPTAMTTRILTWTRSLSEEAEMGRRSTTRIDSTE
jgi:hypothetical protein